MMLYVLIIAGFGIVIYQLHAIRRLMIVSLTQNVMLIMMTEQVHGVRAPEESARAEIALQMSARSL